MTNARAQAQRGYGRLDHYYLVARQPLRLVTIPVKRLVRQPNGLLPDDSNRSVGAIPTENASSQPNDTPHHRSCDRDSTTPARRTQTEFCQSYMRLYPFPSKRFHALLNSLFKVLCNFPSRYLFAIGLVAIFSLRWGLPPALGCDLKQPDSSRSQPPAAASPLTGLAPSMGRSPSQGNLGVRAMPESRT